jgi:hypothetical protein
VQGKRARHSRCGYGQQVVNDGRYLHRNVSRPPTDDLHLAARGEPEMVDEATEARYATAARREADARLRAAWTDASAQISNAVTTFRKPSGHVTPGVQSGVRVVERAAAQLASRTRMGPRGVGRVDQLLGI